MTTDKSTGSVGNVDIDFSYYLRLPRIDQCRLAYEFVGDASGRDAAVLRKQLAGRITSQMAKARGLTPGTPEYSKAINRPGSAIGSISITEPSIAQRIETWKYMLRAGVVPSRHVADAAYALATATIADKESYVAKAIHAIRAGEDPEAVFTSASEAIKLARRERAEAKSATASRRED